MLKVFNTLTRKKEDFRPQRGRQVSFYQCGPTVYWTQHIGNLRAMVLADLMVRSLDYLGYRVKFARNYTDVGHLTSDSDEGEDKLALGAKREGRTPEEIAGKYIEIFEHDVKDLNVLEPWKKPRATRYIKDMTKLVQILLDKGFAYATDLAIYFDVSKAKNYNKLSGQDVSKNLAAAGRGEVSDPGKRQPVDFALWFFKAGAHSQALQTWPHQFRGITQKTKLGFPGWHLECSAMAQKLLGATLDLHMGGVEHIGVHHTNEIAQSEAASGVKFVNYWLHNEHLTVDGVKMSKSGGTAYALSEVKAKGYDPLALRYFYLQAHYRSKQNFTWEALASAQTALNKLRAFIQDQPDKDLDIPAGERNRIEKRNLSLIDNYKKEFSVYISDDFIIPAVLALIWEIVKDKFLPYCEKKNLILDFDRVLGLDLAHIKTEKIPSEVKKLAEERLSARQKKDFIKSDELRDKITKLGFEIEDEKDGYKLKKI